MQHLTTVLNTSIPVVVVPFLDTIGGLGCKEAGETAELIRQHVAEPKRECEAAQE